MQTVPMALLTAKLQATMPLLPPYLWTIHTHSVLLQWPYSQAVEKKKMKMFSSGGRRKRGRGRGNRESRVYHLLQTNTMLLLLPLLSLPLLLSLVFSLVLLVPFPLDRDD